MQRRAMCAGVLGLMLAASGCSEEKPPVAAAGSVGPQGPAGEPGPAGPPGAPGVRLLYGDGSSGEHVVSSDATLDPSELLFTDFTVEAGATLTVPSGTVLRCTGTFTNRGTIVVQPYAAGGTLRTVLIEGYPQVKPAHPGLAASSASLGTVATLGSSAYGSAGGVGLGEARARSVRIVGPEGGGGGGGRDSWPGGAGGGTLTVLAQGPLVNEGSIQANGSSTPGGASVGGGGGGVLVLASATRIMNSGALRAAGAPGSPALKEPSGNWGLGGGGGGGGGLIVAVSPILEGAGGLSVSGGAGGAPAGTLAAGATGRGGGGGGGASVGEGGWGGGVGAGAGNVEAGLPGAAGAIVTRLHDPALVL